MGYCSDEDGNESTISVNKSLFCTTLTEIQTQVSSEEAVKSHLQKASSKDIFTLSTINTKKNTAVKHYAETDNRNTRYSQHVRRRGGLAERYSRPDRFEDSFVAAN